MTGWVALLLGTGEQTFSLVIKNHEMKYLLNYIYIDNNRLVKYIDFNWIWNFRTLYFRFVLETRECLNPACGDCLQCCSAAGLQFSIIRRRMDEAVLAAAWHGTRAPLGVRVNRENTNSGHGQTTFLPEREREYQHRTDRWSEVKFTEPRLYFDNIGIKNF